MKTPYHLLLATISWFLLATTASHAQDDAAPVPERTVSLLDYYNDGGWMMHVLLICSVGTIAVVVYCLTQITKKKMAPPPLTENMMRYMEKRDVTHAYELCQSSPSSFSEVLSSALLKVNFERDRSNKDSMMEAAGEALDQEETRYMLWVNYLNVFATLAPMIGLLGTVVGMIEAFQQLEQQRSQPEELAGGIRQAMVTTAGGLLVGIPSMFFYFFFRDKLTAIISHIQKNTSFLIDVLSGEVKLSGHSED
ncbi:MAG: biopolymer transport protein ExbB [Verrucomicrobiales bacterium]|jgi:biopolymer transport protein ExbB